MANRRLGPIEGDVCWFCKMPGDDHSWMGLGILKRTREPVFDGYHILYHECCAVYSCGAEDTPITGMADAEVMRWYKHGEKASGIGLKCQLCGKRGATTGCFYGPCQQFYHYTCARSRAYQRHLTFSLDGKRLACSEHSCLLPHPHEVDFMGMWMEGVGSWTGTLMEEARNNWLPSYQYYQAQFLQRWEPLLNMTPVCEMRVIQELAKGSRKSIKARQSNKAKDDPDFRVKGGNSQKIKKNLALQRAQKEAARASSSSGGGAAGSGGGAAEAAARKTKQQRAKEIAQGWAAGPSGLGGMGGMNPAAAAAAGMGGQYGPGALQGYPSTSRSSFLEGAGSGELFSPTSARQQFPQQFLGQPHQHHHPQQYPSHEGCHHSMHEAPGDFQQQQWPGQDMAAAAGGGRYRGAAAAGDYRGSRAGGMQGDNKGALKHMLRQAGGDQPPGVLAGNSKHTAGETPELSYQLLLAAAGFDAGPDGGPVWPGQRASVAGQGGGHQFGGNQQAYHQQQGSMLAAAGPGGPSMQRLPGGMQAGAQHDTSMLHSSAMPAAAAGAAAGAAGISHIKAANLGRAISGASSADSAPNNVHQAGRLMQPQQQQQQQQGPYSTAAGPGAGCVGHFKYTTGVLVGPGGPEQPGKQHKLLDLNVLARTGRLQLSHGLIRTTAPEPARRPSHAAQQQQQQQQMDPHLQALQVAASAPGSADCPSEVLDKILAAVKAVTDARGDEEQTNAFAQAADLIASAGAAAAARDGTKGARDSSMGAGVRGAGAHGQMPVSGAGGGGPASQQQQQHVMQRSPKAGGGGGPGGLSLAAAGSLLQSLGGDLGLPQQGSGPGFKASRDPVGQIGQAGQVQSARGSGAGQRQGSGGGEGGGLQALEDMLLSLLQKQGQGRM